VKVAENQHSNDSKTNLEILCDNFTQVGKATNKELPGLQKPTYLIKQSHE
jgi:hypothetical protein